MAVKFVPRITWPKNELLLPPDYFGVTPPAGVAQGDIRYPNIVDVPEMMRLAPNTSAAQSGQLRIVDGLVTAAPTIRFADANAQWRRSSASGSEHGPWKFEFLGGDVFLDLEMGIYLAKSVDYNPKDDLSVQIFARIYEHELLHVLDEIDIATKWLPPQLLGEPTIGRYLVQGAPYVYGLGSSTALDTDFHDFIASIIVANVYNFWVTEKNRRARLRDAPAQYKIVQDQVDTLRQRQINRH